MIDNYLNNIYPAMITLCNRIHGETRPLPENSYCNDLNWFYTITSPNNSGFILDDVCYICNKSIGDGLSLDAIFIPDNVFEEHAIKHLKEYGLLIFL